MNKQFSEEGQMANKYMEKCSTFLVIKEMHIKTTLRFYLTLVRMAVIRKQTTNAGEDVGGKKPSYTVSRNVS
jgi:hypothetical protein